jgi:hypothetical protein
MTLKSLTCAITLLVMVLSSIVRADDIPTYRMQRQADGSRTLVLVNEDSRPSPAAGDRSYDNWRSASSSPPGVSRLVGQIALNGNEFADDLLLSNWQPSIVNDVGFSLWNHATTTMQAFYLRLRFYDDSLNILGIDEGWYSGAVIGANGKAKFFSDDGFYAGFGIPTRSVMLMSMEFVNAIGVHPADLGALTGGPITFGSSSQYIRNMTSGQLIDLGASPQTNLGFFIDTVPVPSPSAASLFAASSLLALRRRRTLNAKY